MKKLIWNTHKNSQSFWGEYHYNASRNWIFYLLEKIKYKILEDLNQIKKSINFYKKIGAKIYTFHPGFIVDPIKANFSEKNYDFIWTNRKSKKNYS